MSRSNHADLARLSAMIDLIYRGATDVAAWHSVPQAISEWVGSTCTLLITPRHTPDTGGFMVTHNFSPRMMELWWTKYMQHDIWGQRTLERGMNVTGNVYRDQDLVTDAEFEASVIYQEFLKPARIGREAIGVIFAGEENGNIPVICSCMRPFEEPYGQEHVDRLALVVPHLSRALGVMFRLRDAEFRVASSLAALDKLSSGVLLFNVEGEVTFANTAAKRILDQADGLRQRSRTGRTEAAELLAGDAASQSALNAAIREAISPDIFSTRHFSRALTIPRPSGKAAYTLHFSSLPAHNEFDTGQDTPRAIAFLTDSATPLRLNADLLKSAYGLTAAEIRTAALMAEGLSLEETAREFGVSVNTIKTQLSQIYIKTNTNSRAKLSRLLLSLTV